MANGLNLKSAQKLSAVAIAAIVLLPVAGSLGDDRTKTETIVPVSESPVKTAANLGPNEWQVETASGSVGVTEDDTPGARELREGMVVAPGARVETGRPCGNRAGRVGCFDQRPGCDGRGRQDNVFFAEGSTGSEKHAGFSEYRQHPVQGEQRTGSKIRSQNPFSDRRGQRHDL